MFTLNSIPDKSSPKSQCLKLIIKKRRGTFVKQASWVNIRICCVENRTQNRFLKEDICLCHMCSSFRISLVTCKLFPTCTHVKFVRTTNQRLWSPNCETGEIPFLQIQTETLPDPELLVVMPSGVASSSQQWPKSPKRNTNVEFMLNIQVRSILNSWPGKISQHRQTDCKRNDLSEILQKHARSEICKTLSAHTDRGNPAWAVPSAFLGQMFLLPVNHPLRSVGILQYLQIFCHLKDLYATSLKIWVDNRKSDFYVPECFLYSHFWLNSV